MLGIVLRLAVTRGPGNVLVTSGAHHHVLRSVMPLHLLHVSHAGVVLRRGRPPGRRGAGKVRPGIARHHAGARKPKLTIEHLPASNAI